MVLKVLQNKPETKDAFSIILEKPAGLNFYPGQYLDIELPVNDPLGKSRIFSLSSSPSEDFLIITVKKGITPYKKRLELLKEGEVISSSHPAGTVVIDDSAPIVMLAGGVGIAPHRSMIKWAVDQNLTLPITLIYSNSDPEFIFKKELDEWQQQLPNLKVVYHNSSQGRLDQEKLKLYPIPYSLYPIFYLAGPPQMVDDFEKILLKIGIDKINIRTDRFDGL